MRRHPAGVFGAFRRLGGATDYAVTFATEALTLLLGLATFKLAATYWGPDGFGEYVLARRGIALLYLPISCGMGLAVTRLVAAAPHSGRAPMQILLSASVIVTVAAIAILGLVNAAPSAVGGLLFGESGYVALVRGVTVAVIGMVTHGIIYSFLRGRRQLMHANVLQFLNLGVLPVAVFLVRDLRVTTAVTVLGAAWTASSFLVLWTAGIPIAERNRPDRGMVRELVGYGLPRVPGEFALSGLFAFPAIIVAHVAGVAAGGYMGFATTVLMMIGSVFAPLGVILLPSMSAALASGAHGSLRRDVRYLWMVCALGALALGVVVELLAPALVRYGLDAAFTDAIPLVRIVAVGAVPFVVYVVLRNVLDAVSPRPLNAINLIVVLVLFVGAAQLVRTPQALAMAFVGCIFLLGVLSWRSTRGALRHLPEADA